MRTDRNQTGRKFSDAAGNPKLFGQDYLDSNCFGPCPNHNLIIKRLKQMAVLELYILNFETMCISVQRPHLSFDAP